MKEYQVSSQYLNRTVRISIRTPLDLNSNIKPNIVYMHDGQNAFYDNLSTFGQSWKIGEALDSLEQNQEVAPTYVVAIESVSANSGMERCRDFSIFSNDFLLDELDDSALKASYVDGYLEANGSNYLKFITEELIPFIEPLLIGEVSFQQRAMIGSSMGGLITHTCGLKYPELFSKLMCLSNAYWYCDSQFLEYLNDQEPVSEQRYYIDTGTREESMSLSGMNKVYVDTNTAVANKMQEKGFSTVFKIIEDAEHNERAWSTRVPAILKEMLRG